MADFARINVASWSLGDTYTASQLNASDAYWPSVLKRDGVGNVTGSIVWNSGGSWTMQNGSSAAMQGNCAITMSGTSQIILSSGTVIYVSTGAALKLEGVVYPTFQSARTRSIVIPLLAMGTVSGGVNSALTGIVTVSTGIGYIWAFQPPHNGATISSIEVLWAPSTAHVGLPATKPSVQVVRRIIGAGQAVGTGVDLSATPIQSYVPVSLADYNNGLQKSATYTCDQNNVVDTTQWSYVVTFTDESGANSLASAFIEGLKINYTAITDMRFP